MQLKKSQETLQQEDLGKSVQILNLFVKSNINIYIYFKHNTYLQYSFYKLSAPYGKASLVFERKTKKVFFLIQYL